jgi:hypothetical protein
LIRRLPALPEHLDDPVSACPRLDDARPQPGQQFSANFRIALTPGAAGPYDFADFSAESGRQSIWTHNPAKRSTTAGLFQTAQEAEAAEKITEKGRDTADDRA